jgi:hypothetical protein
MFKSCSRQLARPEITLGENTVNQKELKLILRCGASFLYSRRLEALCTHPRVSDGDGVGVRLWIQFRTANRIPISEYIFSWSERSERSICIHAVGCRCGR